jgi:hypothetical protein
MNIGVPELVIISAIVCLLCGLPAVAALIEFVMFLVRRGQKQ